MIGIVVAAAGVLMALVGANAMGVVVTIVGIGLAVRSAHPGPRATPSEVMALLGVGMVAILATAFVLSLA